MNKTILVAEDDIDLLKIYAEILEYNGFDVKTATDGEEAVSAYEEVSPGLVILDGDMPTMNGFEAFSTIIKKDKNANVVIVTGYSDFDKKCSNALQNGLISVVSKPIGLDKLLELARKYCNEFIFEK
ncbi:response regulator [Nitrosopumilus sp. K4]|uniref:response regulator n=1 Tax=Nitrosopumilus sp. K4 TaxID=2795383 RepID=UPI001BA4675D|nr:response regulator [Nitrosopumilus sp. K4]QUC64358.1 response regulator [Nitrosopumilus sp. K4]